jgi:hypothetical protein
LILIARSRAKVLRAFALFERDHRGVRLTVAGEAFVVEARLALFHEQRAEEAARAARGQHKGPWKIGYSPLIDRQHDLELQTIENDHRQERDRFLNDAESARQVEINDKQQDNDVRQSLVEAFRQRAPQRDFGRGDPERDQ